MPASITSTAIAPASNYVKGQKLTVTPTATSREDARANLRAGGNVEIIDRKKECFTIVRGMHEPLAQSRSEGENVGTLVQFLGVNGAAFADSASSSALSEPVEFEVVRPGMLVREGSVEFVDVMLRQRVNGFGMLDSLVMGRFADGSLVAVAGCLIDPPVSPPRAKSIALPDADSARAAFTAVLDAETMDDALPVRGWFHGRNNSVVWFFRRHRIDAETGAYLGELPVETGCPDAEYGQ